jgi:hypothetical protein
VRQTAQVGKQARNVFALVKSGDDDNRLHFVAGAALRVNYSLFR